MLVINNPVTWWTAANFLAYGNQLWVCRADATLSNAVVAIANTSAISGSPTRATMTNAAISTASYLYYTANDFYYFANNNVNYMARHPGATYYNDMVISQCDTAEQFASNISLLNMPHSNSTANALGANNTATGITFTVGSNQAVVNFQNAASFTDATTTAIATLFTTLISNGDILFVGSGANSQNMQISGISSVLVVNSVGTNTGNAQVTLSFLTTWQKSANLTQTKVARHWQYYNVFNAIPPGNTAYGTKYRAPYPDQQYVVVADYGGSTTKLPGTVLESFTASRIQTAKDTSGNALWLRDVILNNSKYVYWMGDRTGANSSVNATSLTAANSNYIPLTLYFNGGVDGVNEQNAAMSDLASAWDLFQDVNTYPIDIVLSGLPDYYGVRANYIISNVLLYRMDCVGVFSVPQQAVIGNAGNQALAIQSYTQGGTVGGSGNSVQSGIMTTDRAFFDGNWKYQFDNYSNIYRWLPCNGDVAGLMVRTDDNRAEWWSPAGYNRGQLLNTVKLAWSPLLGDLNFLNSIQVNAIIPVPGVGPAVLMNDLTFTPLVSAFQSLPIRRLFLALEKQISLYAKYDLFEFNDAFTRAQFVATVTPFLAGIQANRGMSAFLVVCDETNNTGDVISASEFVADIYIIPNDDIRYIQLNFVAVAAGVSFNEVSGVF